MNNTNILLSTPSLRRNFVAGVGALLLTIVIPASIAAPAGVQNLDRSGLALEGCDPVAFFTDNKPVKGVPAHAVTLDGATYRFSSAEHKAAFEKEPAKYAPQFGGYCAYGVSRGKLVEVDVDAFQIVDGRLLLQYSKGIRDKFNKDAKANLKTADEKWPELVKSNQK